jgi:hypothetical protein
MQGAGPGRRWARTVLVACVTWLSAPPASGAPVIVGSLHFDWVPVQGCPQARAVLDSAETLLGQEIRFALRYPLELRAVVVHTGSGLRLTIESVQRQHRWVRQVQAESCADLADASALILALAIDPTLAQRRRISTPQPPVRSFEPEPESSVPRPTGSRGATRTVRAATPRTTDGPNTVHTAGKGNMAPWFELSLLADEGALPDIAAGLSLTTGLRWPHWEAVLGATWLPTRETFVTRSPDKGGNFELLAVQARPCAVVGWGSLSSSSCAVFEVGTLFGRGFGAREDSLGSDTWYAPGLGHAVRLGLLRHAALALSVLALLPLRRPEFYLVNVGPVHRPKALDARFAIGLRVPIE